MVPNPDFSPSYYDGEISAQTQPATLAVTGCTLKLGLRGPLQLSLLSSPRIR